MIKIISVAALTIGMATSAMAAGGMNSPVGGQSETGATQSNDSNGMDTTITNSTTGVNGANGAVGSNSTNSSTQTGTHCKNGGAGSTTTGTITTSPSTSSDSASTGTCQ